MQDQVCSSKHCRGAGVALEGQCGVARHSLVLPAGMVGDCSGLIFLGVQGKKTKPDSILDCGSFFEQTETYLHLQFCQPTCSSHSTQDLQPTLSGRSSWLGLHLAWMLNWGKPCRFSWCCRLSSYWLSHWSASLPPTLDISASQGVTEPSHSL